MFGRHYGMLGYVGVLVFFCASERKKIPKKNAGIPGLHLLLALREAAQRVLARINAQ